MFLRRISDIFIKNRKKILSYIFLWAMFFMFLWWINISSYNQNNNLNIEKLNLKMSFEWYKVYAATNFSPNDFLTTKIKKLAQKTNWWSWVSKKNDQKTNWWSWVSKKNDQKTNWWSWVSKNAQKWFDIWNWIVAWISAVLWVLTYMVTMLLDPWFTSWTMFWINDKLHQIWILVSNVVYFIFAFLLIWIAFMNIIWKWDKWELKQAMPKFIVWVLIVPFSWFFVNLIVSLANILTFSALSLPADTFPSYKTVLNKINIPATCTLDLETWAKKWIKCQSWTTNLWQVTTWSSYWLLSTYTYWLLKVDTLPTIKQQNIVSWAIQSTEDLIIYILFSWIFILVYAILIITLAIVLLVRAVWLWIYLALSPLFWLEYFFWKDWGGDFMKKFNVSEFIWLAMVPFYSVLALSFWFLFLSITMQWLSTNANSKAKSSNYEITKNSMTIKLPIKGWTVQTELKVKGSWAFANLIWDTQSAFNVAKGIWYKNWLWFIWAIFMNIFWVVVFRVAVMAALQASTITKAIVAPIKQFGDSVWSLVSKAPTYAPVFGGHSATELWQAASTFQWSITSYYNRKWWNLWSKFAEKAWFSESKARTQTRDYLQNYTNIDNPSQQDIKTKVIPQLDNIAKATNPHDFKEAIDALIKTKVLVSDKAKNITFWMNATDLWNSVSNALTQKIKKMSWNLLDDPRDLIKRYKDIWIINWKTSSNSWWTKTEQTVTHNINIVSGKNFDNNLILKDWTTIKIDDTAKKIAWVLEKQQTKITRSEFINELTRKIKEELKIDEVEAEKIAETIWKMSDFKFKDSK